MSRSVPGISKTIDPPIRTNTPYGGRLEWRLPGENKLIAHLKDKTKIRHRKRWSQVIALHNMHVQIISKSRGYIYKQVTYISTKYYAPALKFLKVKYLFTSMEHKNIISK